MTSRWDRANLDLGVNTNNVFSGGSTPSYSFPSSSTASNTFVSGGGIGQFSQPQFGIDTNGTFDLPGLSGSGALTRPGEERFTGGTESSFPGYRDYRSRSDDSFGRIAQALERASSYLGNNRSGSGFGSGLGSSERSSLGAGNLREQGRGRSWRLYETPRTIREERVVRGNQSGLGGALGTALGIGVSLIPGVGQAAAAAAPALGGALGSGIGGFFG